MIRVRCPTNRHPFPVPALCHCEHNPEVDRDGQVQEFRSVLHGIEIDRDLSRKRIDMSTVSSTGRVTCESLAPTSTRVNIELGWQPDGIVEKARAALGFDQRQVDSSAKDFKQFIENRRAETGAWRGDVN
jgi:hypothetical protein